MACKVLVVGSGAREQCLAWSLSQSANVNIVYVIPGNAGNKLLDSPKICNQDNVPCVDDFQLFGQWCVSENINLVVIGPEVPLANGIVDTLEARGIACFGPSSAAARIEADKAFSKDFMIRHSIPTAQYKCFKDVKSARNHITTAPYPALVVKASGLAAGKGVIVSKSRDDACAAVSVILKEKKFGDAGSEIIVEELLEGEEISVLCFSDGNHIAVMPASQDHKRLLEGDCGPNTGGMGAFCPCPQVNSAALDDIKRHILQPVISGLKSEGKPFVGVLYAGIMLTNCGPKVLEFNCRFGDPECQVLLPLLETDLYEVMQACVTGTLSQIEVKWKEDLFAVALVMASAGYPDSYEKGKVITGLDSAMGDEIQIFQAGTKFNDNGQLLTSGGRVLSIVSTGSDLENRLSCVLKAADTIKFEGAYYRRDIAFKGINHLKKNRLTYAESGVSITNGETFVSQISPIAGKTSRKGCISSLGGFGALFDLKSAGYTNPVLVSGTDGVGTKLMLAHDYNSHATVGIDLVAMCVNDILAHNAEALFFLDYYACGKLSQEVAGVVLKGIAEGCNAAGCALIGGETAEMPGMYESGTYDLAGFAVGAYEKGRDRSLPCIDQIQPGDIIIGVASTGLHSNGFSLVRKLLERCSLKLNDPSPFECTKTLGQCLLTPTAIYSKALLPVFRSWDGVKSVAHITGGGIVGNLSRVLPNSVAAELDAMHWDVPSVFGWIHQEGPVETDEMLRTFNCGLGMCIVVDSKEADNILNDCSTRLSSSKLQAWKVGVVIRRPSTDERKQIIVKNMEKAIISSYSKKTESRQNGVGDAKWNIGLLSDGSTLKQKRIANVAVIISGSGTNMQALINHEKNATNSPYRVSLVVSNKNDAYGLMRARQHGIPTKVIDHKQYKSREAFDRALDEVLTGANTDIVCLAGFMRLLSGWFVSKWRGKILNIHPSLLPMFKGLNAHQQVLDAGVRLSGCSVHFVVEEMDAGAILVQKAVAVLPGDTVESLQERVKSAEHKAYPEALDLVSKGEAFLSSTGNSVAWKN